MRNTVFIPLQGITVQVPNVQYAEVVTTEEYGTLVFIPQRDITLSTALMRES